MKPLIRCSGLDDLFRCHGSRIVRSVVRSITGQAASAGNWCHHEGASRLIREFEAAHFDDHGQTAALPAPDLVKGFKPSWFDVWMADFYVGAIRDTMDVDMLLEVEVALAWEFDFDRPRTITVVEWMDGKPVVRQVPAEGFTLSGHLDALAISPDGRFAKAWDLKTGEVPVDPADENWQVMGYLVLLFLAYEQLQEATFYIVQPRNDEEDGWERVSEVTVKRDQIDGLIELRTEIANAIERETELLTGWKQCRYCPAAIGGGIPCPAITEEIEHMKHLLVAGELALICQSPDTDRLLETYLSLKTLNAVHDQAQEEVKARVDAGGGAIEWGDGRRAYFKEGNGGRVCTDMSAARAALVPVLGGAFDACTKLKFDEAEKACAKALGLPHKSKVPGKDCGASRVKELLAGLVEQKPKRTLMIE